MKKILRDVETHPLTWRLKEGHNIIWMEEYKNQQGYIALEKILLNETSPAEIVDLVKESGLKGRGGAGFLTGIKWSLIPAVNKNTQNNDHYHPSHRYLLCNADEMEPGTYKDKFLMEQLPHLLIEGMIISAFAIQATRGYIFLRGEYLKSEYILNKAIKEAQNIGYLGNNILGSSFSFDIFIHSGAGRYICGEETALINSLEGNRANPRVKPPFPAHIGLWGKPTCVNNVETLSNIPAIILYGSHWYQNLSPDGSSSGTKLMGFSGNVVNPGLWEVPFGITARELLEDYAGGIKNNFHLKAWQPGGASTDFLLQEHLDVSMDFEPIMKVGSRLGTALCMAVDNSFNMVFVLYNLEKFFARESCGLCTPCRDGLPWIVNILKKFISGKGKQKDILLLEELCILLGPGKTVCAHAPGAIEPLQSVIKYFRSDFQSLIK
ncbi:NADH oxidoreductase (quinone) subunit F [Buchnera aphidicola (Thelaxes californica)]|uniref:NADH-quinone oxidoreductase subunit F n=1 Tax=Buchnera aphidicola (Thelaxes californica) TaxID=1315998 RepID=A0A4D6YLX1_9GAMM|nr:NADH-quinone oxidoreductase subunit NuoF [Buchnera aphidicola]QCI26678.1 NADH oxidoreductase (quinone) subunit F [Buchnera aphidicola (Thelaxes californica)]